MELITKDSTFIGSLVVLRQEPKYAEKVLATDVKWGDLWDLFQKNPSWMDGDADNDEFEGGDFEFRVASTGQVIWIGDPSDSETAFYDGCVFAGRNGRL